MIELTEHEKQILYFLDETARFWDANNCSNGTRDTGDLNNTLFYSKIHELRLLVLGARAEKPIVKP